MANTQNNAMAAVADDVAATLNAALESLAAPRRLRAAYFARSAPSAPQMDKHRTKRECEEAAR